MTARTLIGILACVAVVAVAYSSIKGDVSSLNRGQQQAVIRFERIEQTQQQAHDQILRVEEKLDFLIAGKRGPVPPRADSTIPQ